MKTIMPKQIKGDERKWYVIDAKGQTLGRLATKLAVILKGKNKVDFAPHVDN
jgi:large subunit ribosomal protein L13